MDLETINKLITISLKIITETTTIETELRHIRNSVVEYQQVLQTELDKYKAEGEK
jgi:hypothetical protein